MTKAILYVHGKGGSYKEAELYKNNCIGYDIHGVDYEVDFPWVVENKIKVAYDMLQNKYDEIYIIANSIGAYFAMNTLSNSKIAKALFISPIVNMEKLILDMMICANVTEQELYKEGKLETKFGETLSWEYLSYVRTHPITWGIPTYILYAENDNLTSRQTIEKFAMEHNVNLTVMTNGEHWFHTEDQLAFLNEWMRKIMLK